MGSANTTSTGFGERTHLVLKDCFWFTNRHNAEAMEEQTLMNASRKRTAEAMAADAEAAEPSAEKRHKNWSRRLSSGRTGMAYVGLAETAAISAQLPNHPHMLLLLRAFGSYLTGPNAALPSLVTDSPHTVVTRCDSPSEVWHAELLRLFSFKTRGPVEPDLALVRWFEPVQRPAHAKDIRLQAFWYAKVKLTGIQHKAFDVDVVTLASILGPCFMQLDLINSKIFCSNHWVGNTANATV